MYNIAPIITTLIDVFQLIFLIVITLILLLGRKSSPIEDFKTTLSSLNTILTVYKENVLIPRIEGLKKNYDLNPESQSNAIAAFEKDKDKLINEAVKETFSKFLDKRLTGMLETYYTRDGLILFIVTYFRG